MSFDEEKLLQTGIDSISKAFNMKKGSTKTKLFEKEAMISNLQLRISHLENENEQLKSTISILQLENQQIQKQNTKLLSSLDEKKTKLQMIKQSILESTLAIPTIESINTNSNTKAYTNTNSNKKLANTDLSKEAPLKSIPHSKKRNNNNNGIYQLYTKKTVAGQPKGFSSHRETSHSYSITNTISNSSINNTTTDKTKTIFNNIETKINKIKGNLSSREHSALQTKEKSQSRSDDDNDEDNNNKNDNASNTNDINTFRPKLRCSNPSNKPKSTKIRNEIHPSQNDKYELTNRFLNECNSQLSPQTFEQILSLFEFIKDGRITPDKAYSQIKNSLQSNMTLIALLDSLCIIDN